MPRTVSKHVDSAVRMGARLRRARLAAGLSQRGLSFDGCSPAYISRLESGDRVASLQLLVQLGERLGVSGEYLATGVEPLVLYFEDEEERDTVYIALQFYTERAGEDDPFAPSAVRMLERHGQELLEEGANDNGKAA